MKIVLAEDEPKVLEFLELFFRDAGHEVLTTSSGQGTLDLLRSAQPDVLLLDLWLTDNIDGMAILKQHKQLSPKTSAIVISGTEEESAEADVRKLGAVALLKKPIRLDELDELVRRLRDRRPDGA